MQLLKIVSRKTFGLHILLFYDAMLFSLKDKSSYPNLSKAYTTNHVVRHVSVTRA